MAQKPVGPAAAVAFQARPLVHGRPRLPSKQDLLDFAFGVPDSPPNAPSGRKTLQNKFSKILLSDQTDDVASSPPTPRFQILGEPALPFDGVMVGDARHQVCNDSLQPWTYLLTLPGKNVRDQLISAFNKWIGCDPEQLITVKQVIAYLHSASLIVDDIEDESVTRRGLPAAHIKFGVAPSLNAANYVYFLALEKLLTLQSTEAVFAYSSEMCNLHRGQGRDIFWRVESEVVSEDRYLQMVHDKTGGLFRLAIRIMVAVAPLSKISSDVEQDKDRWTGASGSVGVDPLLELCNNMAAYFQIRDDLINLASPAFHAKKGFCEDITEGKLSFVALHALRTLKGTAVAKELLAILVMKTVDARVIRRALTIMDGTDSFNYCLSYLDKLKRKIDIAITELGGNEELSVVMATLARDLEDCRDVRRRVIGSA